MTNRRSSLYSLRVATINPQEVVADLLFTLNHVVARPATDTTVKVEDGQRLAVIGFRAKDDDEARRIADLIASPYDGYVTLLTGFGAARREVEL